MDNLILSKKGNYAILQLNRGKGNAIGIAMMNEIITVFKELKEDDGVHGVILTGHGNIFSVGLDVKELLTGNKEETNVFFNTFGKMVVKMATFPKLLISAINGHSPAGGCVMAICSDYRVMADGAFTIGLNEVPVGIMINPLIYGLYAFWIGTGKAYHNFLDGKLCTPSEAKAIGLVEEVVAQEKVLERAEAKMQQWLEHDFQTVIGVKNNVRIPHIGGLIQQSQAPGLVDVNEHFWKDSSRETLMKVIMTLQAKKNNS